MTKSHKDYLEIIGETAATTKNYREKRHNQYYFKTFKYVVHNMLKNVERGSVLDVGTSHGNWFAFLSKEGFRQIFGVEIDPNRASLAKQCGYTEVYNCDASNIPHPSNSIDAAVSNDVFVHILKLEDKISVVNEVERVLKPGGVFIFNHAMSPAYKHSGYHIEEYCSFLDLHKFISFIVNNSNFEITDIKPTYYNFRSVRLSIITKLLRLFVIFPLAVNILFVADYFNSRRLSLEESDTVYIKLRKNG